MYLQALLLGSNVGFVDHRVLYGLAENRIRLFGPAAVHVRHFLVLS
jgi:hypothetical protein